MDDPPLQAALERLAEADIVLVQGLPPDADYTAPALFRGGITFGHGAKANSNANDLPH
jgi:hypothetical protein